jgi:hypothetical protein
LFLIIGSPLWSFPFWVQEMKVPNLIFINFESSAMVDSYK